MYVSECMARTNLKTDIMLTVLIQNINRGALDKDRGVLGLAHGFRRQGLNSISPGVRKEDLCGNLSP